MICRLIPTWWHEDLKGNVIDNVTDIDIVNVNGHSNVNTRAMSMSLLGQAAESGTSPGTAAQKPQHRSAAAVGWLGQDHINDITADDMASLIRSPATCYIY